MCSDDEWEKEKTVLIKSRRDIAKRCELLAPILQEYFTYVSGIAENARNRSAYDELIRYLKRMRQYTDGTEMVQKLCKTWILKYPTRKVMVQELGELLKHI